MKETMRRKRRREEEEYRLLSIAPGFLLCFSFRKWGLEHFCFAWMLPKVQVENTDMYTGKSLGYLQYSTTARDRERERVREREFERQNERWKKGVP
jgi:hypothetical protein